MRRSAFVLVCLLLIALATSGAEAQRAETQAELWFEPHYVEVKVGGRVNVTVHVYAALECSPLSDGPGSPIQVSGKRAASFQTAGGYVYRLEPLPLRVAWQQVSENRYMIDEAIEAQVISETNWPDAPEVHKAQYWTGGMSGQSCTPSGYRVANSEPAELQIRVVEPPAPEPEKSSVGGPHFGLVVLALVLFTVLALLRTRRPR